LEYALEERIFWTMCVGGILFQIAILCVNFFFAQRNFQLYANPPNCTQECEQDDTLCGMCVPPDVWMLVMGVWDSTHVLLGVGNIILSSITLYYLSSKLVGREATPLWARKWNFWLSVILFGSSILMILLDSTARYHGKLDASYEYVIVIVDGAMAACALGV